MFATIENFQSVENTESQDVVSQDNLPMEMIELPREEVQAFQEEIRSLRARLAEIEENVFEEEDAGVEDTMAMENTEIGSDEPVDTSSTVTESFTNPSKNQVQSLIMILLVMCLFYLLSHPDTMKALTGKFKKLGKSNAHLVMTLVFGVSVLVLKRFL